MSGRIKVVIDSDAVRELLQSQELSDVCSEITQKAADKLGEGYESTVVTGRFRAVASVSAETQAARRENLKSNKILKAVYSEK